LLGTSGELPHLLKHDGYTASYFPVATGIINVCWEPRPDGQTKCGPKTPGLAFGHAVYHQIPHRWTHFEVRLTRLGRMRLADHRHLNVYPAGEYTPLDGVGGQGLGPCGYLLSAQPPTQPGSGEVCSITYARRVQSEQPLSSDCARATVPPRRDWERTPDASATGQRLVVPHANQGPYWTLRNQPQSRGRSPRPAIALPRAVRPPAQRMIAPEGQVRPL
jgi:hypothetical protein